MKPIQINNEIIGDGYPTYVIAEIGINHNGSVSLAKEMISAAWESGADAVKIQTFITKKFLHPSHPGFAYDIKAEIPHGKEMEIWDFARQKGINLFSTPEEFESLDFIRRQSPSLIKIAAMDFNYKDFIKKAAALHKPIILSSGMSTMDEVISAIKWVEEAGNDQYIVLHCVSCYPALPEACNLSVIPLMKKKLDCPVGFSDHTEGISIPIAAIALGANVIEKHFTIDKTMPGPDQKSSMDPSDLKSIIRAARDIEKALGDGCKKPALCESAPRIFKRRGVYAARAIKSGVILKDGDAFFFAPSSEKSKITDWPDMIGHKIKRNIPKMGLITTDDIV